MIPLSDYDEIHSRPGRKSSGDDGFSMSTSDESILDRAWKQVADDDGVKQIADQPSPEEIKHHRS